MKSLSLKSKIILKIVGAIIFLIVFSIVQYKEYQLSQTDVSGRIDTIWTSEGRHSSTLMYEVEFSYGFETINANGFRRFKHAEGDTFTNRCQYVFILGCSGTAYTGHVDTWYGNNHRWFSFPIAMISLVSIVLFVFRNLIK